MSFCKNHFNKYNIVLIHHVYDVFIFVHLVVEGVLLRLTLASDARFSVGMCSVICTFFNLTTTTCKTTRLSDSLVGDCHTTVTYIVAESYY
jgi:hypothetical protein